MWNKQGTDRMLCQKAMEQKRWRNKIYIVGYMKGFITVDSRGRSGAEEGRTPDGLGSGCWICSLATEENATSTDRKDTSSAQRV